MQSLAVMGQAAREKMKEYTPEIAADAMATALHAVIP